MADKIRYTLIRSDRKTLCLCVTRRMEVLVRSPRGVSAREIDRFVQARRGWIEAHLEEARRFAAACPEPDEAERAACVARARAVLPGRVAFYAERMGVAPAGIRVTDARTRFGSCSGKNRLCFSWRLMRYPDAAVDYVVVHELAHILRKDHSPAFYHLVAAALPDHQARRALLKQPPVRIDLDE